MSDESIWAAERGQAALFGALVLLFVGCMAIALGVTELRTGYPQGYAAIVTGSLSVIIGGWLAYSDAEYAIIGRGSNAE